MDHELTEQRHDARFHPPANAEIRATVRPGCAVVLVNVSARGALVQAPRPLRPGARVHLQVVAGLARMTIPASLLRCLVRALDPVDGVIYQGALRFDHRVEWAWAEPTRSVHPLPEHCGPAGMGDGNLRPAGPGAALAATHS